MVLRTLSVDSLHAGVDSLWLLIAATLVVLMTPGVAFFYGGRVRSRSIVSMLMMSIGAMALVGVLWVLYGFGLVFGPPLVPHVLGNPFAHVASSSVVTSTGGSGLYDLALAGFQATFAIFAVALISGAIAERAKFGPWMVFAGLWVTLVYCPVAYSIFNGDGWAPALLAVNDLAGGAVVHISAGAAALALALVLGKRTGFRRRIHTPHNVPLALVGAALLWFGWFGFNAGSELAVDTNTALAWINTLAAPGAAIIAWLIVEWVNRGKASSIGAASGAVAGLVAITPACNILTPGWAIMLGFLAGAVCAIAIELKFRLGFDDSLDVVGIHLVGGVIGMLYIGVFGTGIGLIDTGSVAQLGAQAIAAFGVMVYSFVIAWLLGIAIQKTIGFRIANDDEVAGIDTAVHGEEAYSLESA